MSRIFISHSSANSAEVIAVRDWMKDCGREDVFLDLDPERGLVAGERWQAALAAAVDYCELVIFLVSPEWAASTWCKAEFLLTKHGRNPKAIITVLVAPTPFSIFPGEMLMEYQSVDLTLGERTVIDRDGHAGGRVYAGLVSHHDADHGAHAICPRRRAAR